MSVPTYPITSKNAFATAFATIADSVLGAIGVKQAPATITDAAFALPNKPDRFYLMNSSSGQTLTIPSGMSNWAPGTVITLIILGVGQTTVIPGVGVTINNQAGVTTRITKGQYTIAQLVNVGPDIWIATAGGFN